MKKIISVAMALAMLVSVFALCTSAKETVDYPLSATVVNLVGDGDNDLYVVFSEPVKAPTSDNALSLVAYGWPATAGDPSTLRYGTRDTMTTVVAVSDTVWKFTLDGHKSWMLSGDIASEGHYGEAGSHPVDGNPGAYWSFMLFGGATSKDGTKTLAVEEDKPVLDNSFGGTPKYGYTLVRGQSANSTEMTVGINVVEVSSVSEMGTIFVTAYDVTTDNDWIYLAFSEPVTLGSDFQLQMFTRTFYGGGANDYALLYQEKSDKVEQVDTEGKLYRVANEYWQINGDCSSLFDPTASGYFGAQSVDSRLVLKGTVTAKSGTNTVKFSNKDNSGDNYGGRFHNDLSGTNFENGCNLTFTYTKVDSIDLVPYGAVETADISSVVALIGVISLAGVTVICKKH